MDEGFIVYRKMYVPPLTPDNIGKVNPGDCAEHLERFKKEGWQRIIEDFFRKQIRVVGSCAILAWDGVGVIGKMYFTSRELYNAFRQAGGYYCVEHETMPGIIKSFREDELERLLASESRTVFVACFNVGHFDTRYHGKGIASAMLEVLKDWARERGWRRLEMPSCGDIVPFRAVGAWMMRKGWLERRGFYMISETRVPPEQAEARRNAIELIAARESDDEAWDFKFYSSHIQKIRTLAHDSSWKAEYDKDYLMAYDL
jgi:GNAT superfamily N-acetyltransferase